MADDIEAERRVQLGRTMPELSLSGSASAPFVYFDVASTYGFSNGIANVTLEASRALSIDGRVVTDRVVVAHLRMSRQAALGLRAALNGIELLATPKSGGRDDH